MNGPGHLLRQAREAWEVPRDLLLRRYPPFVTGGALPRGHVPVFVFHDLEPQVFGRKLAYLAENGYQTLSAPDYLDVLLGGRQAPEKAVVLTFDDGRESLLRVGLPLMQRYGMRGILFAIPGRMETARPAEIPGTEGFLTWDELAVLAGSGLFDIQSHTLSHARIHTAPRLGTFMHPALRHGYRSLDAPLIHEGGRDLSAAEVPLGTPLLVSAPRTSESRRFYEEPAFRRRCTEEVAMAGGEAFFQRPDWQERLRRLARAPITGRYESLAEQEQALRVELVEARRQLEERLDRAVVHLCYPWHVSGPTARRLAREAGYRTAFWGKVPGVTLTPAGGDPLAIARIGEDYVERLPGRGRWSLAAVLRQKWSRRMGASK